MNESSSTFRIRYTIPPIPQCEVLFVSEAPCWPLDQGFRLRGFHMAKALTEHGLNVAISSIEPMPHDAAEVIDSLVIDWPCADQHDRTGLEKAWSGRGKLLRHRIARFQGRNLDRFAGIRTLVHNIKPRVVVALGQHGPLLLQCLDDFPHIQRIWYAADEPAAFQISCMKYESLSHWPTRLRNAALYALIQRAFNRSIDGVIGVKDDETAKLRRALKVKRATTIQNGVDTEYFDVNQQEFNRHRDRSLIFWGRMDFEPNVDAVLWFAKNVWPVISKNNHTTWTIAGKNPVRSVIQLADKPGIEVTGGVDDLRPHAHRASVTVLPMRCGGGIKNKLLEAAAMARPIIASRKAIEGLAIDTSAPPLHICQTPAQWIDAIESIWQNPQQAQSLGQRARAWVMKNHSWPQAAEQLMDFLKLSIIDDDARGERIAA